jgi:sugar (pentulose or hexulose) kinase
MYLGLDLGTTNVKALVVDQQGRSLTPATCPVQLHPLHDGGVEQNIDEIWTATLSVLQQATAAARPSTIRAIGVSSQGGAMQLLSAGRKPIGSVISWLDQRGQRFADRLTQEVGPDWLLERIRQRRAWLSIGQLLRLAAQSPESVRLPNSIGFVGDLIVERLCGRPAHDGTSAGLTLLYNPRLRSYDPDLLQRLQVQTSQLPEVLSPRDPAGMLLASVAAATGLPTSVPVSAAIHDQYASALAAGVVQAGTVMVGTGTAWVLLAVTDDLPTPATDSSLICHHLVDGLYGQILSLVNGGSAVTWALELLGQPTSDPAAIEHLLASAPPGSDGLCFWPFLTPFGASGLPAGTRGRLAGLQLAHGKSHLLRSVVEGLAFELKRHLDVLESAGHVLNRLVLTGGAAHSRITPQIVADVTGLPLTCCATGSESVSGAAIVARGLLEPERSLAELAGEMPPAARHVSPGPEAALYARLYKSYLHSLPGFSK